MKGKLDRECCHGNRIKYGIQVTHKYRMTLHTFAFSYSIFCTILLMHRCEGLLQAQQSLSEILFSYEE